MSRGGDKEAARWSGRVNTVRNGQVKKKIPRAAAARGDFCNLVVIGPFAVIDDVETFAFLFFSRPQTHDEVDELEQDC